MTEGPAFETGPSSPLDCHTQRELDGSSSLPGRDGIRDEHSRKLSAGCRNRAACVLTWGAAGRGRLDDVAAGQSVPAWHGLGLHLWATLGQPRADPRLDPADRLAPPGLAVTCLAVAEPEVGSWIGPWTRLWVRLWTRLWISPWSDSGACRNCCWRRSGLCSTPRSSGSPRRRTTRPRNGKGPRTVNSEARTSRRFNTAPKKRGQLVHQDQRNPSGSAAHRETPRLFMQDGRRSTNASFIAQWRGSCERCGDPIEVGQRARYDPRGRLVHHSHERTSRPAEVCDRCWLVKPCECEG